MKSVAGFLFFLLFSGLNGANAAYAMKHDKIFVRSKFLLRSDDPFGFWSSAFLHLVFAFAGALGVLAAVGIL